MAPAPRICVVVPVYNHGLTIQRVVGEARAQLPVIVVNDGSTDETPRLLSQEPDITVVSHPVNRGKAAALLSGFEKARALGFSHAITIDADGQHETAAIATFAEACRRHPEAFLIGVRNLVKEDAPRRRRLANALSTFWFKAETGVTLSDTQCGFRCYPLEPIGRLRIQATRYAYELEVMVKAAWMGIPLIAVPVASDYQAPTSRLSHFRPFQDMMQMSRVHSRLCLQAFCVPAPLRRLSAGGVLRDLPRGRRLRTILEHLFTEHTETPGRVAAAVALGLFCGIAPIWGYQMIVAALLAHKLRLNKAIALTASNISFPLAVPFILAAALVVGHFLFTREWLEFASAELLRQIPRSLLEWAVGSCVLALLVGVTGGLLAYAVTRWARARRGEAPP